MVVFNSEFLVADHNAIFRQGLQLGLKMTSNDYSPQSSVCACVCVCWSEAYQPYSILEAGPTENRLSADKQGAAWDSLCVFVIWISFLYHGTAGMHRCGRCVQ